MENGITDEKYTICCKHLKINLVVLKEPQPRKHYLAWFKIYNSNGPYLSWLSLMKVIQSSKTLKVKEYVVQRERK